MTGPLLNARLDAAKRKPGRPKKNHGITVTLKKAKPSPPPKSAPAPLPPGTRQQDVAPNLRPLSTKQRPLHVDELTTVAGQEGRAALALLFPNDIIPHDYRFAPGFNPVPKYVEQYKVKGGARELNPASINWNSVAELCKIQCNLEEITAVIGLPVAELNRRCQVIFGMTWVEFRNTHQTDGKASLRRKMIEKAMTGDGDTPMLKHLSAHYLGMTAQSEAETSLQATNIVINFADLKRLKGAHNA